MGRPVVVVTHSVPEGWPRDDAPFSFVTDGIEAATERAKALAGDKVVGVNGGTIASQCLDAGLLDEIWVDLVPVLLGGDTPTSASSGASRWSWRTPSRSPRAPTSPTLRYRVRYPARG